MLEFSRKMISIVHCEYHNCLNIYRFEHFENLKMIMLNVLFILLYLKLVKKPWWFTLALVLTLLDFALVMAIYLSFSDNSCLLYLPLGAIPVNLFFARIFTFKRQSILTNQSP